MPWTEMLAHLCDYRNPFVTVELLPKFSEPKGIKFGGGAGATISSSSGAKDASKKDMFVADDKDGDDDDSGNPKLQRCAEDVDGGAYPQWDSKFVMNFKPPKKTSCRVLFTDVTKLWADDQQKYVVVMVREAPDKSLFMTAYDPRNATEYELLGGPPHWEYEGVNDDSKRLLPHIYSDPEDLKEALANPIGKFAKELDYYLSKSSDPIPPSSSSSSRSSSSGDGASSGGAGAGARDSTIRIGGVITPRLLVSVFNRRGASEELLASCQVSISSVLSGTGTDKVQWTTLLSESIADSGVRTVTPAGEYMNTFILPVLVSVA
jgi:hypothetical protein